MNRVVILNFSGKKRGNCSAVADYICQIYARTNVRSICVSDYFSPCGNCAYECLQPEKYCPRMGAIESDIINSICESDLTYYIIPNYCGSPCANYYAFNERTVGWFDGDKNRMQHYMEAKKKFIFISNTESEAFHQVIAQHSFEKMNALYLASRKYNKHSVAGDLLDCDAAKTDLDLFILV